MPVPDVSIVVVTHDSADVVGRCLAAVGPSVSRHVAEVLVVDNASSDATVETVRRTCPDAWLLRNPRNEGFARANNRAIARARGRHVLLLNPDTLASPGAIDALLDVADRTADAGVLAPRLVHPDGRDQGTARAFPTLSAALFGRRSPLTRWFPNNRWSRRFLTGRDVVSDHPFEVDWVSGACMLVPRHVIAEVGPLDPGYFMYWEDADWCRRIKAHGFRVLVVPDGIVVHHEGADRHGWPARQVLRFHRAAYRYVARNHLHGFRGLLRPPAAIALALRALAVLVVQGARRPRPAGGAR